MVKCRRCTSQPAARKNGRPSEPAVSVRIPRHRRKLAQARRLALEPTDPLTRERLAQLIEELESQLQDQRRVA